jgi:hypothetical protein
MIVDGIVLPSGCDYLLLCLVCILVCINLAAVIVSCWVLYV